ncbi:hypothetical protein A2403_01165 [Candidatus Roizmanbacteria bacterium RIFOXYC1_FULL_41_16]|nr:MAG: hypothetical protein A2377_01445 [Candidatus Roizmanbacteria bacterium RIFOXYB1_FULL_41_27]OGK70687.1 MAG: hypothetical protein A2403_01165 [Candidatus Roizmanbacteria bacterium RIFOXYC1_FULL_41_16]OGK74760.1 MAG: hypothetical protein A2575_04045 [Candidatus Roizmanbacteria bacterium RIFOXYD1_FULL_41_24]OGK75075.1 MAG: hypothetical protein A2459_02650 [Candidatus Roizmanbacteria bacterium RIFOXYC2_FULL_41_10]
MFDKKFNIIIGVFLLLFISISYLSLSNSRLPIFTQASNKEVDINKTVVIISKLEALADSNDQSVITVFTRNSQSVGIENQRVDISTSLGTLSNSTMLSDNYGKTEFQITSDITGTAELSILVNNQPVLSQYSIKFVSN